MTPPFTPLQIEALRTLIHHWQNQRFVLIGASALGCHLEMEWRKTNDLDIVISVDKEEFFSVDGKLSQIPGWSHNSKHEHRWNFKKMPVDIIPTGKNPSKEKSITWPRSDTEMSLAGMDLAFSHSVEIALEDDLHIEVATLPVIVILKMASFCDRPYERERDLKDISYILSQYLEHDDRCFSDPVIKAGINFDDVNAFLCGQDLAAIITTQTHENLVRRFLDLISDERPHFFRMVALTPLLDEKELAQRIAAFRQGLGLTSLQNRTDPTTR